MANEFTIKNGLIVDSGQLRLNSYTSSLSFTGPAAGYLAFDATGGVVAVSASAGGLIGIGQNNYVARWNGVSNISTGSIQDFIGRVDISGSLFITGSVTSSVGFTGSLLGTAATASYVVNAQTASYVVLAQTASYILQAVSSSYVLSAQTAQTASYVVLAQTASYVTLAQTASYVATAQTASYVVTAQTASYILTAQTASYVLNALSASYHSGSGIISNAITASYALTASYVQNAISSSFVIGQTSLSTPSTIVARDANSNFSASSINASLNGNANTATNISNTGTVTLGSATEQNSISITSPSYTTDQPVKLLNFDWYGNTWQLGNIRGSSTPSNGFGVFASGVEKFRFTTTTFLINSNTALHAGNYSSYSPSYTGSAANALARWSSGTALTSSIIVDNGARILVNGATDDTSTTVQIAGTLRTTSTATIGGSITATSIIKSSGTSAQFLKADGSTDSNTYLTTGAAAGTYLTSTNAANTYQTILTNPITGSGVINYLAKFSSTSALTAGLIYDNGTIVGVNTTGITGGGQFQVNGDVNITGNYKINGTAFASSQWTTDGTTIYYNTGKVMINTTTGFYKFTVNTGTNINLGIGSGTDAIAIVSHGDSFNPGSPVFKAINFVANAYNFFPYFTSTPTVTINGGSYGLLVNGTAGATAFYETSDIKLKNVIEINPTVDLSSLNVIKYTLKEDKTKQIHYGYSAQDVQLLCSDLVKNDGDKLSLNYTDLHTLKIAQLERRIKELEDKLKL
jgi:hypothetical protein